MSKATRHFTTYFSHFSALIWSTDTFMTIKRWFSPSKCVRVLELELDWWSFPIKRHEVITQYTYKNVLDDVPASWNTHMHKRKHTLVGWWIYPVTLTRSLSLPKCETTGVLPKDGWLCIIIHLALSSARVNAHSVCYEPWPLAVIYSFRV